MAPATSRLAVAGRPGPERTTAVPIARRRPWRDIDDEGWQPMIQSERAMQRLMMCEDCRVTDVVQDQDAMRSA